MGSPAYGIRIPYAVEPSGFASQYREVPQGGTDTRIWIPSPYTGTGIPLGGCLPGYPEGTRQGGTHRGTGYRIRYPAPLMGTHLAGPALGTAIGGLQKAVSDTLGETCERSDPPRNQKAYGMPYAIWYLAKRGIAPS